REREDVLNNLDEFVKIAEMTHDLQCEVVLKPYCSSAAKFSAQSTVPITALARRNKVVQKVQKVQALKGFLSNKKRPRRDLKFQNWKSNCIWQRRKGLGTNDQSGGIYYLYSRLKEVCVKVLNQ
ncbi:hypothetical protein KI387_027332, partial [Taxus chinensis]